MRTKIGVITSAKMQKTVTVTVHRYVMHVKYSKRYRVSKKFLADTNGHDDLGVGDEVQITECRPLSKRKSFKVTDVRKKVLRVAQFREEEIEKNTKRDHRDAEFEKNQMIQGNQKNQRNDAMKPPKTSQRISSESSDSSVSSESSQ